MREKTYFEKSGRENKTHARLTRSRFTPRLMAVVGRARVYRLVGSALGH